MQISSRPMRLVFVSAVCLSFLSIFFLSTLYAETTPLTPNTADASGTTTVYEPLTLTPKAYPVRIVIPDIGLDSPIEHLGVNDKGEMDVPDGNTNHVGWFKDGTVPGDIGSAVMDAHVYAAFEKLRYLLPGGDVYVVNSDGTKLHFIVAESLVYPLAQVPAKLLFERDDARRLNLITCAGKETPDGSTYSHRLIAYTVYVGTVESDSAN